MIREPNFSRISPVARDLWFLMSVGLIVLAVVGGLAFFLILG
jgi:hypothetical protein